MKKLLLVVFIIGAINRPAYAQADSPYAALGHAIGTIIGTIIARMNDSSREESPNIESPPVSSGGSIYRDEAFEKQKEKCASIENTEDFLKCMREVRSK